MCLTGPRTTPNSIAGICSALAALAIPVIFLKGNGRRKTGPLVHWPRRALRNSPQTPRSRPERPVTTGTESTVRTPRPRVQRTTHRRKFPPMPCEDAVLSDAVARMLEERRARIAWVQRVTETLHTAESSTRHATTRVYRPAAASCVPTPEVSVAANSGADRRFYRTHFRRGLAKGAFRPARQETTGPCALEQVNFGVDVSPLSEAEAAAYRTRSADGRVLPHVFPRPGRCSYRASRCRRCQASRWIQWPVRRRR